MNRGIYILANDKVADNTIALLNSIRAYDSATPVVMIPYDEKYHKIFKVISGSYGVRLYENLQFVESLTDKTRKLWNNRTSKRANLIRKFACWFGTLDEFLYIDTDTLVFEKIIDTLGYLSDFDFVCCDYQYMTGTEFIFTDKVVKDNLLSKIEMGGVFNAGFWASKKNLFSEQDLYEFISESASHPGHFYFEYLDQSLLNYIVLKRIKRRFNIAQGADRVAGSWAGSKHFKRDGNRLIDPNAGKPLKYLHWAGIRIQPGCTYWDVWKHYRYLNAAVPNALNTEERKSFWASLINKIRRTL